MTDHAREIGARAIVARCVAVSLFGVAATVGWIIAGAPQYALGQIALAASVVVIAAIRGFGGLLFKHPPSPAIAVATDVGICVAGLVLIALVGSLNDSSGYALYTVLVGSAFLVPAVVVVSVIIEIVVRQAWLIWSSVALAAVVGIISLAIYALSLSR